MTSMQAVALDLPDGWRRMKLKYVASLKSGSGITSDSISEDGPYPVYGGNGIRGFTSEFTHEGRHVLIGRQGALCGNINYADGQFWASEHAVVADILGEHSPTWLGELLRAMNLNQYSQSAAQPGLAVEFIANLEIPVPPLKTQRAIADFLDAETARIDALIAAKENLLAILAEKRRALVTQAVTRGLDPSVPMRDSGIPWLGDIPAHWEVTRVGLLASVQNGSTPSRNRPEYWDINGIPWVSSGQVNDYDVTQAEEYISEEGMGASNLRIVPAGSVLVGMVGQGRTRGMSARLLISACINQNVAAVTPRDSRVSGDFLHLVFQHAYDPLRNYGRGGNQAALNCEIIGEFQVPLPPRTEQDDIVDSLRHGKERLEALESAVAASLPFIRERREAVIAAAVTGQLDVEVA
ncbi:MAG: restriction endonuclease subunit S [Myxococcales bacterium]|nr:restriction endonuclease subunit S [Myxococcales bacterium]